MNQIKSRKVDVIVPIFNMGDYLEECLDSCLSQTLRDIQIICINDGSSDNSIDILRKYEQADERIIVIDQENKGVAYSRNEGMRMAKSEFIAFMDPDDYYPQTDILESFYNKAKEENVRICGGEMSWFKPTDPAPHQVFPPHFQKYVYEKEGLMTFAEYQYDYGYHRYIYDREMLVTNDIFFPPYSRFQDPPFFVRAMITAQKFYAMKKVAYAYRVSHKVVDMNETKTADMYQGIRDVWDLATQHKLPLLQALAVRHVKSNVARTIKSMTPAHKKFVLSCERVLYIQNHGWLSRIFHKRSSILNADMRVFHILGVDITTIK